MSDGEWLVSLDDIRTRHELGAPFGARLVDVDRGRAVFELPLGPGVAGGVAGGAHGGVLATLADIAVVTAVLSSCRTGEQMRGTAELNISYLRPAIGKVLRATANVIKKGRTLAVGDVDIHNDEGALVAKSRVTYALGKDDA